MPVYVDPMMACVPNPRWTWSEACHLVADELDQLHAFARRLGLHREWFQDKSTPHYDLTRGKREAAVRMGAIEIDRTQLVALMEKWRTRRAMEAATPGLFGFNPQGRIETEVSSQRSEISTAADDAAPEMQRGLFG